MASKPPQPAAPQPLTKGAKESVPCPWCSKPNDMCEIYELGLLEPGAEASCDHCNRMFKVAQVKNAVVVFVKPFTGQPRGFRR